MGTDAAATCSVMKAKKNYKGDKGTPWRKPQVAWEPRSLAGDGPGLKADDICAKSRGRWAQMSFSVSPCRKLKSKLEYPLQSLLKKHERKKDFLDENMHVISSCPTRRKEMTNPAAAISAKWWPYKSKPKRYSQRAIIPL